MKICYPFQFYKTSFNLVENKVLNVISQFNNYLPSFILSKMLFVNVFLLESVLYKLYFNRYIDIVKIDDILFVKKVVDIDGS